MTTEAVLTCRELTRTFMQGPVPLDVLTGVNLEVGRGDRIAIIGQSGAGKTTLLHMLGGLDMPTSGSVCVDGRDLAELGERQRSTLRNRSLGFVYQLHHLLSEFTALENAAMPLLIGGASRKKAYEAAQALLVRVGLGERMSHKPAQLSGGERQRVAIARALVAHPHCVLLDEPTGNLDHETAEAVHQLLIELNEELQISLVVVTHDNELARRMGQVFHLRDGRLHEV